MSAVRLIGGAIRGGSRRPRTRGQWARRVARQMALGGTSAGLLGAAGYGLLWGEAKLARRIVKPPTVAPPLADGRYGAGPGPALRLAILGDSSAAGLGAPTPAGTPGALLATGLSEAAGQPVVLHVPAVVGSQSDDLAGQVSYALRHPPQLAVVMIGANDVTHLISAAKAVPHLAEAVTRLRAAGAEVVVGTCPDLGTVKPIAQPLRYLGRVRSRQMARAQAAAVVGAGGLTVSLGDVLGPMFDQDKTLWSADRFHPSAEGYQRVAAVLLPALRAAAGLETVSAAAVEVAEAKTHDVRLDPASAELALRAAAGEDVAADRASLAAAQRRRRRPRLYRPGLPGPDAVATLRRRVVRAAVRRPGRPGRSSLSGTAD